ncbi:MAG: PspA/IM30 family protein [Kangiellaceae bacterium]|nr:PspA/IM30 family protein [Kangiellaceae bacterium]MCW9017233.1 PspA/IM30 family protein [Kangiellaceae bacterium]
MSIMQKIMTAVRGSARELGEAVVDSQSMRIFEQELFESKENLAAAKDSLTEIMASKMATERKIDSCKNEITEHESYAKKALEKGEESLALEIAGKVGGLEENLNQLKEDLSHYEKSIEVLKTQIANAEKSLTTHERDLNIVKTRESVQKASVSVSHTIKENNLSVDKAGETLEKIKEKQQHHADKVAAAEELAKEESSVDLDEKLKASGIKKDLNSAEAVLARIKGG